MASGGIHLVAGFALGSRCRSISTALVAGIASHAVLDAVPHRDYRHLAAHMGDGAVGLGMTSWLWRRCASDRRKCGLAGAIGAILPDIENVLALFGLMDEGKMRFPSHTGLIPHGRADYWQTSAVYGMILAASWATLRRSRR